MLLASLAAFLLVAGWLWAPVLVVVVAAADPEDGFFELGSLADLPADLVFVFPEELLAFDAGLVLAVGLRGLLVFLEGMFWYFSCKSFELSLSLDASPRSFAAQSTISSGWTADVGVGSSRPSAAFMRSTSLRNNSSSDQMGALTA